MLTRPGNPLRLKLSDRGIAVVTSLPAPHVGWRALSRATQVIAGPKFGVLNPGRFKRRDAQVLDLTCDIGRCRPRVFRPPALSLLRYTSLGSVRKSVANITLV